MKQKDKRWIPPRAGMVMVNVDGAFNAATEAAGIGVIIRDCHGQPLLIAWEVLLNCRDAEEAEARACLRVRGIRLTSGWPEVGVVLETDCASSVIAKVQAEGPDRSQLKVLIDDN